MTNEAIIRAIEATLKSWETLTDEQRGPCYQDAVNSLAEFAQSLKEKPLSV